MIDDRQLTVVLGRFAGLAAHVVEDPVAWLGTEQPAGPVAETGALGRLRRAGAGVRHLLVGRMHPGAPGWDRIPVQDRCQWWVRRIAAVAAPIAATPRIAGALGGRVPVQAALGAAAAGLAVCAIAREHGLEQPEDWVPLLSRVLFGRDVSRPAQVPSLPDVGPDPDLDRGRVPAPPGIPRRAVTGLWRLAGVLWALPSLFDERPRGWLLWRAVGTLPLVGLPAGVLDERGAIRRAAQQSRELLVTRR